MNPRVRLIAAALMLIALPALASSERAPRGASARLPAPAWTTWDDGLRAASTQKRPVLVDVYTDWCGYCRKMEREVYARDDVRDYLSQRFVTVKVNAESSKPATIATRKATEAAVAARYRVTGYPTTVFLKANGEHLANVPGYVPADRFLLLLRYIGDGHLERGVSFDDFAAKSGATNAR